MDWLLCLYIYMQVYMYRNNCYREDILVKSLLSKDKS